jgi:parallel beta-helix repeat protein
MKILYGSTIGSASGSVAGNTYSRNRYGAYIRNRAKPILSNTVATINQKAVFSAVSRLWGGLTQAQQGAWKGWAANTPIIDRLGQSQILSPNVAFMRCNVSLVAFGVDSIVEPPTVPGPTSLIPTSVTITAGTPAFTVAYAESPLPDNIGLMLYAAVPGSAGIQYVENSLKHIGDVQPEATSPVNALSMFSSQFGAPVAGQRVFLDVYTIDTQTGLKGPRSRTITTIGA